ncbi:MAG: UDP-N-acetylglucosamine 1-carboxyvinyltransferase [Phycisphaerae bacterium]|nr:UDP-N-acetylglucosamine 1-carboxyvinyltransferase [Phycisphaerae bacterium]HPC22510.1 UDP-N-acetylglucosamine 1-carboxyvinyltransferase [Phycisphaerae bacterium]HRS28429.1 UDP-N-acetylglucosamine 1-carboxyvinyltransferase [Phycisphaerae bacterium]HRT43135.1 UDP-N-acetylglucosamine 1-carboxyvinyltransferase [Phycisphaerae bacterium]
MGLPYFEINGGTRLRGSVRISGAKNAALPIMAASILCEGEVILHDVPNVADVVSLAELLNKLGVEVDRRSDGAMRLVVRDEMNCHAEYDIVRKMRASICVLGPLLAKRQKARVSMPGGCAIGDRPVNLHLRAMRNLGADIDLVSGDIVAKAKRLRGTEMFLGGPFGSTVLGTANAMMAATLSEGTTVIEMAACEPEVVDLANFLNACGASITGQGTPRVIVEGVKSLKGCEYRIIPDRIEAGTFMVAAAITNGELEIENCRLDHLMAFVDRLSAIGVTVERVSAEKVNVSSARRLEPIEVTTQPFPGFPTDLQAQMMALLCLADGNSIITEKIFPDRFLHVAELARMGALLHKEGPTVIVEGVKRLIGAPVMASDLRASAALVLAGLCARGVTRVNRVYHLERGYSKLDEKLRNLGAEIERREGDDL